MSKIQMILIKHFKILAIRNSNYVENSFATPSLTLPPLEGEGTGGVIFPASAGFAGDEPVM